MTHNATVCHISFNHPAFDDRIYWKELMALKEAGFETIHLCVGEKDEAYVSNEGIKIIQVKKRKLFKNVWVNRIAQLFFFKRSTIYNVFEKAKSVNAFIYHYHDLQINAIAQKLKNLQHKPKVIYDAHEAYHLLFKENAPANKLYKLLYNAFIFLMKRWELKNAAYCDYIIATDQYTLEYFNKHLPNLPKAIVYNYSFFSPYQNKTEKEKKYHFIYTGLLSKGRGIKEIIQSVSLLSKEIPDVNVLLIGSFENESFESAIKKQITELKVEQNIQIHAAVPFTEIAAYYQASCIGLGLFHSTPEYTTFIPIKLFEYMAFGLPVIFSNHGPSAQIIAAANCGLLVEPTNIEGIYKAMKSLLLDKKLYETYSTNAIAAIKNTYSWQHEKTKLLAIYDKLKIDN